MRKFEVVVTPNTVELAYLYSCNAVQENAIHLEHLDETNIHLLEGKDVFGVGRGMLWMNGKRFCRSVSTMLFSTTWS